MMFPMTIWFAALAQVSGHWSMPPERPPEAYARAADRELVKRKITPCMVKVDLGEGVGAGRDERRRLQGLQRHHAAEPGAPGGGESQIYHVIQFLIPEPLHLNIFCLRA